LVGLWHEAIDFRTAAIPSALWGPADAASLAQERKVHSPPSGASLGNSPFQSALPETRVERSVEENVMSEISSTRRQLVWLPAAGTLLSILSCYGILAIITGLSLMGITLAFNVHVWAVMIVAFALIAVLGLALGYRQHGSTGALMLGIVGAIVVIFSLYGSQAIRTMGIPRDAVEIVGFAGLIAAAIWDWRLRKT
jgi:hypothetical protein